MADIAGYKVLTRFAGSVEYVLEYQNPLLSGHRPGEEHIETEVFFNVRELERLMSAEFMTSLKHAYAADRVIIVGVYVSGHNDEGDAARLQIGDEIKGAAAATVSEDLIDSKMMRCVTELQKQAEEILNTIQRYQNKEC